MSPKTSVLETQKNTKKNDPSSHFNLRGGGGNDKFDYKLLFLWEFREISFFLGAEEVWKRKKRQTYTDHINLSVLRNGCHRTKTSVQFRHLRADDDQFP